MKVIDTTPQPLLKALIYGNSGVGKTTLLGSACECEETSPLLVLDAGGQPISLRFSEPPPLILELEDVGDLNAPYAWLSEQQPWAMIEEHHESVPFASAVWNFFGGVQGKFKMVAIDSITHVQRLMGDLIVGNRFVSPGDIPKALEGWGQWRKMLGGTDNIAKRFYSLPMHVMLTALTRHSELPTMGIVQYYPFLRGQSALEVPSRAELVGRLMSLHVLPSSQTKQLKEGEPSVFEKAFNVLITQIGRDYDAKWQGLKTEPEYILAPTMRKLLDILKGGVK
jgi:hypothetical protein